MKRSIISFLMLLCCVTGLLGQEKGKYEARIDKYHTFWRSMIPKYYKIQYAGSMGFLSFGVGWDYGKRKQWETDIFVGFVPKYSSEKIKLTFTVKENFTPWSIPLGDKGFSLEPLSCGLYLNTVSGNEFWSTDPDRYPKGYYNMSTKVRLNIFVGERITFKIPEEKRINLKAITFFYEISSCDLYIISAIQNRYLKPSDYLGLSLGLQFHIF